MSLKHYKLSWTNTDPFGKVIFGSILLNGRSLPANRWRGKTKAHVNSIKNRNKSHFYTYNLEGDDQLICYFDVLDEEVDPRERLGATTLLQISTWV